MATTRESFEDAVRWIAKVLRIGLRRALVIGVLAGLFAVLVVVTTRETVSDCGDITAAQKEALDALSAADGVGGLRTSESARCIDGEFAAPLDGIAATMEPATAQVVDAGWQLDTEYIAFHRQLWRRCFHVDRPGWEQVQILLDASRGGGVVSARVTAPEGFDACELERRDTSLIYPP